MKNASLKSCVKNLLSAALLSAAAMAHANEAAPAASAMTADPLAPTSKEDGSYLMGLQWASQLSTLGIVGDLDGASIQRGITDGLSGKKLEPVQNTTTRQFVVDLMQKAFASNIAASKAFMDRNAKTKGVVTTASGLQYRVVNKGDVKAASPTAEDTATVNYRGTLIDGSEFDSSYKRGQAATFPVTGVIKGWQEALVMMKPGAKWELFVPPELGYGQQPRATIPGGSVLIFEVELLSVTKKEAANP